MTMVDHDAAPAPTVDVHQHLWPQALVEQLRRRTTGPRVVGHTIVLDGEPPSPLPTETAHERRRRNAADGLDLALLALSSPIGLEQLPPDDAQPLLSAWHDDVAGLTRVDLDEPDLSRLGAWASTPLAEPDLDGLGRALDAGCVGVQVPADAMATPAALTALAPVLAVAAERGRPAFVHPGRARGAAGQPAWWAPVVDYAAQSAAAWWAWHAEGRRLLPDLRICFGAGAGLAPLHHERLAARGGRLGRLDPGVFVETSSYGPQAVCALSRVLGVDALVLGSDRPYAEARDPGLGEAARTAMTRANPARLLGDLPVDLPIAAEPVPRRSAS